jgi:ATP-dependent Clp protease adaptor protein ClpS
VRLGLLNVDGLRGTKSGLVSSDRQGRQRRTAAADPIEASPLRGEEPIVRFDGEREIRGEMPRGAPPSGGFPLGPARVTLLETMSQRGTADTPDVITRTRTEKKLKPPPLYRVLLHNDDYTTMEFVVQVLQSVFDHPEAEATQIMLHVHRKGIGVAGVYPHEIAETKIEQVHSLAKANEYPLRCSMEEA